MPHGKRIAELLLDIAAVKISVDPPFTWTSGMKSPIYCDNRMVYSHPVARDFIVDALVSRVKTLSVEPDVIAGTATASIGWAALVADRLKLPTVYVRHKSKEYGAGKNVEGDIREGKDVVVIEDLISTGGSAIRSVESLRTEADARVHDVLAIFTYEFSAAAENAQKSSVIFHALCDITTLLEVARAGGQLSDEDVTKVLAFTKDPAHWST